MAIWPWDVHDDFRYQEKPKKTKFRIKLPEDLIIRQKFVKYLFFEFFNKLTPKRIQNVNYIFDPKRKQKHRLHMVSPSPWPIYSAISAFLFVIGMVLWMHYYTSIPLICGFIGILSSFYFWFRDIIREGVYMGYHTKIVESCLRFGFVLFLVSEVMFFFGFFWALLDYTLTPSIIGGGIWPPQGIVLYILAEDILYPFNKKVALLKAQNPSLLPEWHYTDVLLYGHEDFYQLIRKTRPKKFLNNTPIHLEESQNIPSNYITHFFYKTAYDNSKNILYYTPAKYHVNLYSHGVLINPFKIPLLNTAILITSGFTLTLAHAYLRVEYFRACFRSMIITICLGLYFISLQCYEYVHAGFSMNDGTYGSIFYMLTGFHGFHVIIGTTFLIVIVCRLKCSHFTANNHFAFEASAWYWHFVDVVWILLYILLYLWPNSRYFKTNSAFLYIDYENFTIYTGMTVEYFFSSTRYKNLQIPTNINFEYDYLKKLKVLRTIINHFKYDILYFEYSYKKEFKDIHKVLFVNYIRKLHFITNQRY